MKKFTSSKMQPLPMTAVWASLSLGAHETHDRKRTYRKNPQATRRRVPSVRMVGTRVEDRIIGEEAPGYRERIRAAVRRVPGNAHGTTVGFGGVGRSSTDQTAPSPGRRLIRRPFTRIVRASSFDRVCLRAWHGPVSASLDDTNSWCCAFNQQTRNPRR
jgi:hypothetical protein